MSRTLSRRGGALAAGLALALSLTGAASAAPSTTYVLQPDLGVTALSSGPCALNPTGTGWCVQNRGGGTLAIAPSVVPKAGPGSLAISTPGSNDKAYAVNSTLAGKKLSTLTQLAYESYVMTLGSDPRQAPALNIAIASHKAGAPGYATLVWEPLYSAGNGDGAPVTPHIWQSWTPSSKSGWWAPQNFGGSGGTGPLGFAQFAATFDQVKAALPDATIYAVGINQGGGNAGLSSNVDLLRVNDTTYNFELDRNGDGIADTLPPTSKEQCKDEGYASFNNPSFKNQGQCVSYVNHA